MSFVAARGATSEISGVKQEFQKSYKVEKNNNVAARPEMPSRRRNRKRNMSAIAPPVSQRLFMYSGTTAKGATNALTITTKSGLNSYRVCWVSMEVVGSGQNVAKFQFGMRGEDGETESTYSFPFTVAAIPRTYRLRQTRGQGFWSPKGESEHVGWIKNLGDVDIVYTALVCVSERLEYNVKTNVVVRVFPDNESPGHPQIVQPINSGSGVAGPSSLHGD